MNINIMQIFDPREKINHNSALCILHSAFNQNAYSILIIATSFLPSNSGSLTEILSLLEVGIFLPT